MGLRKDLDSVQERFIYYLMDGDKVIYVGTAIKPKQRYKSHLKRSLTQKAPLYQYIRKMENKPTLLVKSKINCTYNDAEVIEIQHIEANRETVLNFYNNPNKGNLEKLILNR